MYKKKSGNINPILTPYEAIWKTHFSPAKTFWRLQTYPKFEVECFRWPQVPEPFLNKTEKQFECITWGTSKKNLDLIY